MNNCTVCDGSFRNDNPNKIICDGICRQCFHADCVNFSKDALRCYREMPNLQWFCDGCIVQTCSSNVLSPPFNKLNSTVVIPTSSSSHIRPSFIAANRNRKLNKSSVSLSTRSPNVKQNLNISNVNNSICSSAVQEKNQPENQLIQSPRRNGSNPLTTSVHIQSDVTQSKPLNDSAVCEENRNVSSELKTPPGNSGSFAEVLTKSLISEHATDNVKNSKNLSLNDSIQSQPIVSPPSETQRIIYLSNLHPSVTEEVVVDYLLNKKLISSAADVSCQKLLSPYVNMDSISFVSFKITVNSKIFHSLVNKKFWPDDVIVREFVKR